MLALWETVPDATDPPTIHRLRVAFKMFRYTVESLAQVRPGTGGRRLRALHDYQTRMGEIQDIEVLLARAKRFVRKRESAQDALETFEEELRRRRARLVQRFMASLDQLWDCWPSPSAPAATGRKATARR